MYEVGEAVEVYDADISEWVPGKVEHLGELTLPGGEVKKAYMIRAHDRPFDPTKPNMYAVFVEAGGLQVRKAQHA